MGRQPPDSGREVSLSISGERSAHIGAEPKGCHLPLLWSGFLPFTALTNAGHLGATKVPVGKRIQLKSFTSRGLREGTSRRGVGQPVRVGPEHLSESWSRDLGITQRDPGS